MNDNLKKIMLLLVLTIVYANTIGLLILDYAVLPNLYLINIFIAAIVTTSIPVFFFSVYLILKIPNVNLITNIYKYLMLFIWILIFFSSSFILWLYLAGGII
jgi:hypothetical protein